MDKDSSIYQYRKRRGLTQDEFADRLEISRTTTSFLETKRQYPDFAMAEKMAEVLGTVIGKLYSPEELEVIQTK